jgi:DNA-binding winged helix-turn-helix (wHTH) protein
VSSYRFGPFDLDLLSGELRKGSDEVSLEPRVFALLCYLVENAGRVIKREELSEKIWPDTHVSDASLTQAIASLRDALEDEVREPRYVATLPRRGYKFVGKVARDQPAGGSACHIFYGVQDFILAAGENIIGRAGDAAVRIKSDQVSRHHARIMVSTAGATIEDLGSRNGTWVIVVAMDHGHEVTTDCAFATHQFGDRVCRG